MNYVTHPSFSFFRKIFGLPCSKRTVSGMLTSQPRICSDGETNFSISQLKDRSTKTKSSLGAILALFSFFNSSNWASSFIPVFLMAERTFPSSVSSSLTNSRKPSSSFWTSLSPRKSSLYWRAFAWPGQMLQFSWLQPKAYYFKQWGDILSLATPPSCRGWRDGSTSRSIKSALSLMVALSSSRTWLLDLGPPICGCW